jgi:arsenate reductase-like glutaredoxin family protein
VKRKNAAVTNLLTETELAAIAANTPRPRRDNERVSDAELAHTIMKAWSSSRRPLTIAADEAIQRIRRGGGR